MTYLNIRTFIILLGMIILGGGITAVGALDGVSDLDEIPDASVENALMLAASDFAGTWNNSNPNASGMIKFVITKNLLGSYMFQGYGKCTPTPCDWGKVPLVLYSKSIADLNDTAATAKYTFGFKNTIVTLRQVNKNTVKANVYNEFTDASGRHNYFEENMVFKKKGILPAPRKLSPANGSIFSNFPRTTTLKWASVVGAKSYTVEIDCYHCCQANKWCTEVGDTWKIIPNIMMTTYTFTFVGAQPGRWRVWAVDENGQEGKKSRWWYFTYTV